MNTELIKSLRTELDSLTQFLSERGEWSFVSVVDDVFRKSLLLAAASFFESALADVIREFAADTVGQDHPLYGMVEKKGIDRQYHTWFDWDRRNANRFFAIFGESFKTFMETRVRDDPALADAISAFMEVGSDRNALVHQNFASFTVEKTANEIFDRYEKGLPFVVAFRSHLSDYCAVSRTD